MRPTSPRPNVLRTAASCFQRTRAHCIAIARCPSSTFQRAWAVRVILKTIGVRTLRHDLLGGETRAATRPSLCILSLRGSFVHWRHCPNIDDTRPPVPLMSTVTADRESLPMPPVFGGGAQSLSEGGARFSPPFQSSGLEMAHLRPWKHHRFLDADSIQIASRHSWWYSNDALLCQRLAFSACQRMTCRSFSSRSFPQAPPCHNSLTKT